MTTMKDLIAAHRRMRDEYMIDALGGNLESEDAILQDTNMMGEYMNEMAEKAQSLLLEKISEKDFVEAMNAIVATVVYGMLTQNGTIAPVQFLLSGDIQPFVHTVTLSVIGMLIDEEVL